MRVPFPWGKRPVAAALLRDDERYEQAKRSFTNADAARFFNARESGHLLGKR